MSNIAIILASGTGSRLGDKTPKQYLTINGKTILEYSFEKFQMHDEIDNVYVVCSGEFQEKVLSLFENFSKFKTTIIGGKTRMDSTKNAVNTLSKICSNSDILLFHDCARPFVTQKIISENIFFAKKYGACSTAIPVTNTVYNCKDETLTNILNRENLFFAQTPQSFSVSTIKNAFDNLKTKQELTDDASVVFSASKNSSNVHIVLGDPDNFKITTKTDFALAKIMLAL